MHHAQIATCTCHHVSSTGEGTDATITLDDLDQRFQALLKRLQGDGICRRGESVPPIITKEHWLQVQWTTIQRLASVTTSM
jgi:hypothetical protein